MTVSMASANVACGSPKGSPKSLCKANENVLFSCSLGKKTVSLCTSDNGTAPEYLEYRFGTPAKIELSYKGTATDSPLKFKRSEVTYASNAATIVWFKNSETNYLLHFPADGGPLLEVIKDGKTIAELSCKNGWADVVGNPTTPSKAIQEIPSGSVSEMSKNWGK